jgi:hypothetical protein
MLDVLATTKLVFDQLKHVSINTKAITSLSLSVQEPDLRISEVSLASRPWHLDTLLQIIFVFNTINYCFWAGKGEPKWTVVIDRKELDGSAALFRCIEQEVAHNPNFLSANELADLTRSHLNQILQGNIQIPLMAERLQCLHEVGRVLEQQFDGSFRNVLTQAHGDALALADLIVGSFLGFDDRTNYQGKPVGFYKRAQLNSKMISDALAANGQPELHNLNRLTAFADYKIPQILRNLGIIKYSPELADKIDSYQLILKDSADEVEIRAATVWAVELIKEQLQTKYNFVTAAHVDSMLWNRSQSKIKDQKPYHRTLTTAY